MVWVIIISFEMYYLSFEINAQLQQSICHSTRQAVNVNYVVSNVATIFAPQMSFQARARGRALILDVILMAGCCFCFCFSFCVSVPTARLLPQQHAVSAWPALRWLIILLLFYFCCVFCNPTECATICYCTRSCGCDKFVGQPANQPTNPYLA